MIQFLLVLFVLVSSAGLTGLARNLAARRGVFDVPNQRSSHSIPTPRGGGIAIALSAVVGWLLTMLASDWPTSVGFWILSGVVIVGVIGLIDDLKHVPPIWRLATHVGASILVCLATGGIATVSLPGTELALGWASVPLTILLLVAATNIYNFMDGIDGIAGAEAVTTLVAAAGLLYAAGEETLAMMSAVLCAAVIGFLYWNWPPARIFMGDVGSGFLGFSIAVLAVLSHVSGALDLWVWAILLGVFVVDATLTLAVRLVSRKRVHEAHRSHAYQKAAMRFGSHLPVTVGVTLLNIAWLLPIALLVAFDRLSGVVGLTIAYLPLAALAMAYRAGRE